MESVPALELAIGCLRRSRATLGADFRATHGLSSPTRQRLEQKLADHDAAITTLVALRDLIADGLVPGGREATP